MRKSDLDMARLVGNMSNPVSQCIPQSMYVGLHAGAEHGIISPDLSIFYTLDWV